MKKIIFSVLGIMLIGQGFAQLSITPELGYNQSVFYTTASSNAIITSPISGFQAGALVTKPWFGNMFLQTGLEFAQKGSYQGRGFQAVYGSNTNLKLSYLQAPLNLGGNYKISKNWKAFASGGLYAALGISGTEKGTSVDLNGSSTVDKKVVFTRSVSVTDDTKTYIKPIDTGYDLSAGISFHDVLVKTVFSRGFGNVSPVGTTSYKNQVWNFSLGYICRID